MKTNLAGWAKTLILSIAAITVFTLSQSVARADEVTLSGSTTGVVSGVSQLSFLGNVFTGRTVAGVGSLSGANGLGTFILNTADSDIIPLAGMFTLNITFTQPTGINGGGLATFTAQVLGSISSRPNEGGLNIHFTTPSQLFTFNDGTNSGTFSLVIPDVFVQTDQTARLTAGFFGRQDATVPEPATLLLLGSGLTGIAAKLRNRKKAREARDE